MCRKKYKFLFYVANVFSEAGQHGDNLRTFLDAYRLEKPPKNQSDFPKSITTGIPIQMDTRCRSSSSAPFRSLAKNIFSKLVLESYLELEAQLEICL